MALSFNRWGDKFVTSNSDHLQQIVDLHRWQAAHPPSVTIPSVRRSIASDGPQAEVFRASPLEPWRVVRTRLRVAGIVGGPVEGGGRAAGYFTGATGTWIADQEAGFSKDSQDAALICDVGSNLIHRKTLIDQGLYWHSDRADANTELLRSTDTWFRPVQLGDGPDGAIYVADMYREIIEHPKSLPEVIKKHLDLTSGRDRGRIWRLVPDTPRNDATPFVNMMQMNAREWCEQLESPIAWRRRMASQLLLEKPPQNLDLLRNIARDSRRVEAQILALHVLNRLEEFDASIAQELMDTQHPRAQQHLLRLIRENRLAAKLGTELDDFVQSCLSAEEEPQERVLLELAMLAADLESSRRIKWLAALMPVSHTALVHAVMVVAAQGLEPAELVQHINKERLADWLSRFAPVWIKQAKQDPTKREWLTHRLARSSHRSEISYENWLSAFSTLGKQELSWLTTSLTQSEKDGLRDFIQKSVGREPSKYQWILLLEPAEQIRWAETQLSPASSLQMQSNAIQVISTSASPASSEMLLERFAELTPRIQQETLRALASRRSWSLDLLKSIETGQLQTNQIPIETRSLLLASRDKAIAHAAANVFKAVSQDRAELIRKYEDQWTSLEIESPIALERGQKYFSQFCAQCHQLGEIGKNVGAPLKQLGEKTPEQLLISILDPNREVDPRFTAYSVLIDDQALAGVIENESATQITLVESGGKRSDILREDIQILRNQGKSLMPTGMEEQLNPQQLRELIYFLRHSQ